MPTVLFLYVFRFFFYSNEGNEPAHIHVTKSNCEGKIWLEPEIQIAWMKGFTTKEENIVWQIVSEHEQLVKNKCLVQAG